MKRKVTSSFFKQLQDESELWSKEGSISEEQRNSILENYEIKPFAKTSTIYTIIGILLISLSLFLLIGLNVIQISAFARLLIAFIIWIISFVLAENFYQKQRSGSQFLFFFSSLLFGVVLYGINILIPTNILTDYIFFIWGLYCLPVAIFRNQKWVWIIFLISLTYTVLLDEIDFWALPILLLISLLMLEMKKVSFFNHNYFLTFFPLYIAGFFYIHQELDRFNHFSFYFSLIICLLSFSLYVLNIKTKFKTSLLQNLVFFLPYLTILSGVMTLFNSYREFNESLLLVSILHAVFFIFCIQIIKKHTYIGAFGVFITIVSFLNEYNTDQSIKVIIFLLIGIVMIASAFFIEKRKQGGK